MKHGARSAVVDGWVKRLAATGPVSTAWSETATDRDSARRQRLIEANGELSTLLWVMLILGAVGVVGFVLLYADPEERALGQGFFAGSATAVVVTSLLAVALLASPFQGGNGSIHPNAMRYTLALLQAEGAASPPCDASGNPM